MIEEIKEIEQYLKKCSDCFTCNNFLGEDENGGNCMLQNAYNYITNLQKENEEFYQLMEMQNKREYRSKFLKDFQKEHGENVFPDYDEIYKKYDDYKQRNEKAVEYIKSKKVIINTDYIRIFDLFEIEEQGYTNDLLNILQGGDE